MDHPIRVAEVPGRLQFCSTRHSTTGAAPCQTHFSISIPDQWWAGTGFPGKHSNPFVATQLWASQPVELAGWAHSRRTNLFGASITKIFCAPSGRIGRSVRRRRGNGAYSCKCLSLAASPIRSMPTSRPILVWIYFIVISLTATAATIGHLLIIINFYLALCNSNRWIFQLIKIRPCKWKIRPEKIVSSISPRNLVVVSW